MLRRYPWIVLTRVITDMNGRDAEKYSGLFEWIKTDAGDGKWMRIDGSGDAHVAEICYRARILEIHERKGPPDERPKGWARIFPTVANKDAWARIVRISRPLESVPCVVEKARRQCVKRTSSR